MLTKGIACMNNRVKEKGVPGSTLKIFAIVAMIIDHIAWCVVEPILQNKGVDISDFISPLKDISVSPVLCVLCPILHFIGRMTFPIMLFILIEGFKYTRNVKKYIRNMAIFALVSEIPYNLAFDNKLFAAGKYVPYLEGQNVFITLTLCLITLVLIKKIMTAEHIPDFWKVLGSISPILFSFLFTLFAFKRYYSVNLGILVSFQLISICSGILVLAYLFVCRKLSHEQIERINLCILAVTFMAFITFLFDCDYRVNGIIAVALMYLLRENKTKSFYSGCALLTSVSYFELGTFMAVPLVRCYNGKRGLSLKYLFYIIYPLHLIVLWLIALLFIK